MAKQEIEKKESLEVQIKRQIILGTSRCELERMFSENKPAEIHKALDAVFVHFKDLAHLDKDAQRGLAIERLNLLFLKSLQIQDYKACLAIQKEINNLLDLKITKKKGGGGVDVFDI